MRENEKKGSLMNREFFKNLGRMVGIKNKIKRKEAKLTFLSAFPPFLIPIFMVTKNMQFGFHELNIWLWF